MASSLPLFEGNGEPEAVNRSWARFSPCNAYRYLLGRRWAPEGKGGSVLWVMLNPSTADATADDPTIRRCVGFSKAWGYGALEVVNLFAFRATDPADLRAEPSAIGPENDQHILDALRRPELVVAAWGAEGWQAMRERAKQVGGLLMHAPCKVSMLGATKDGSPRHPLYVRGDAQPLPYDPKP